MHLLCRGLIMIDHIGIAVKSLIGSIDAWEVILGVKSANIVEVQDSDVKVAFFDLGNAKIELLESVGDKSSIKKFIDKRGEGVHHIAIKVDDLNSAIELLRKSGKKIADPFIGAEGFTVAFIHPSDSNGVLIELVEKK